MADADDGDKTEAPTPKRRQEARENGQVARSTDLTAAALLIGAMLLLRGFGPNLIAALGGLVRDLLGEASLAQTRPGGTDAVVVHAIAQVGVAVAPLGIGVMLIAVVANMAQTGLTFNPALIALNPAALNPFRGLSKLLGKGRGPAKFAMTLLKVGLVGLLAWSAIASRIGPIVGAQELDTMQIFAVAGDAMFAIGIRIGTLLFVLAVIDYVWQRRRMEKELRMTKQQVKDEMRNMDGDPHVKARRRQLQLAALKERLKVDVPTADVVVTNPTEFAVAIRYDPDAMNAPRVVAKGQGFIAARIRELAIEAGVPILERKPLARALYKLCDVGSEVPEQFFSAVAEILAYVYELNGRFRQKHRKAA